MKAQRLRNLTTGKLHTRIEDVYVDLEYFLGGQGLMTHMLPNICDALLPYLREKVPDARFWDGRYDITHVGDVDVPPMDDDEKERFMERYEALPHPFFSETAIPTE